MGCPPSHEAHTHRYDTEFILLVRRLAVQFQLAAEKLLLEGKRLKGLLKRELNKPLGSRSGQTEEILISDITRTNHMKAIHEYLALQCRSIIDRQRFVPVLLKSSLLDPHQSQAKLSMRVPIEIILFGSSVIRDQGDTIKNADLAKFGRLVGSKFRDVREPQTVEHDLLNYYKGGGPPSEEMLKEAVFQLCLEFQVPVERFRETGHNYQY